MTTSALTKLLATLANRDSSRTEAIIQADVRQLLLSAPLDLEPEDLADIVLESQVGDRRRIDVELGATVIEVKKDLRKGKVRVEAIEQLYGYVASRMKQTSQRYVGLLTDGALWECYHTRADALELVTSITVDHAAPDLDSFLIWLEGVLGTAQAITPTPAEIEARLGAHSSSHALDSSSLRALYLDNKENPSVILKRTLWARLLTSALGTQFEDSDELFIEHTLLVNSADIIAHALLGLPVATLSPASLLAGSKFDESGIRGVVERDFFDWVIEVPSGPDFVRSVAKRLVRFDWSKVDQDVLKFLYESVIGPETRKRLGEYYTPNWLAYRMVKDMLSDPLATRVLDPACGSGTFLFHAVRIYIEAAEKKGHTLKDILTNVTQHVIGLELHPVAVSIARVTYLLALGRSRLVDPTRGPIQIPVYLGDSIQWREQQADLLSSGTLTVHADDKQELFPTEMKFPDSLLEDAGRFDQLVQELADRAAARKPGAAVPSISGVFQRLGISAAGHDMIKSTFKVMCNLHDQGRDHIWGYYIRNLARPMWLSRGKNRVDLLIGNPPWLAYRHMTGEMQEAFRRMSESRGLWHGAEVATHQDLSALFVARAVQLYLKQGGRFAMVMPNAAVDRAQFGGFRTGKFPDNTEPVAIRFLPSWDLRRLRPHFFPRGSSVVFGSREQQAGSMPVDIDIWTGRLPVTGSAWSAVESTITRASGHARIADGEVQSPYRDRFLNGAVFAPRVLFMVDVIPPGPLGLPAGRLHVRSSRNPNEKKPWSTLQDVEGTVETEFVRPMFNGENLLPYRLTTPTKAVVPWEPAGMLAVIGERIELYPGLAEWWRQGEQLWLEHRSSERLTLIEQLNYQSKLESQFPIPAFRVIYNASGMHLNAALVDDARAVINNGLYWATTTSLDEASYLCAILNSPVTTEFARPYMSYGKDERHFHKHIWELPIEEFDASKDTHARLSFLGKKAHALAISVQIDENVHFSAQRRRIRNELAASKIGEEIDQIVYEFLS
jgi:hypothetical protein